MSDERLSPEAVRALTVHLLILLVNVPHDQQIEALEGALNEVRAPMPVPHLVGESDDIGDRPTQPGCDAFLERVVDSMLDQFESR